MTTTPPVDHVREALRLVIEGFSSSHVSRDIQQALTWSWEKGLIESVTYRMTPQGERYYYIIDKGLSTTASPRPFEDVSEWAEWLRSLDPITAIRVGSVMIDGTTIQQLAAVIDEITYAQTTAGGGEMTQVELADAVGVSPATIARRAGRRLATQRKPS